MLPTISPPLGDLSQEKDRDTEVMDFSWAEALMKLPTARHATKIGIVNTFLNIELLLSIGIELMDESLVIIFIVTYNYGNV